MCARIARHSLPPRPAPPARDKFTCGCHAMSLSGGQLGATALSHEFAAQPLRASVDSRRLLWCAAVASSGPRRWSSPCWVCKAPARPPSSTSSRYIRKRLACSHEIPRATIAQNSRAICVRAWLAPGWGVHRGHYPYCRLQHAQGEQGERDNQVLGPRWPAPLPGNVGTVLPWGQRDCVSQMLERQQSSPLPASHLGHIAVSMN